MFDTMLSREMQQTLDHFRRTVDQLFKIPIESAKPQKAIAA